MSVSLALYETAVVMSFVPLSILNVPAFPAFVETACASMTRNLNGAFALKMVVVAAPALTAVMMNGTP
jgi:hypothetical protein